MFISWSDNIPGSLCFRVRSPGFGQDIWHCPFLDLGFPFERLQLCLPYLAAVVVFVVLFSSRGHRLCTA